MIPLPDNTTDRLLAVADIIEFTPDKWNQELWLEGPAFVDEPWPTLVVGRGVECGTAGCVAGWGVALTPRRVALGLDYDMSGSLFSASLSERLTPSDMADILRRLAKLPEGGRTYEGAESVLSARQFAEVFDADNIPGDETMPGYS